MKNTEKIKKRRKKEKQREDTGEKRKNNGKTMEKERPRKKRERGKTAWECVELHRYACVHTSHSFQVTSVREIT